jgi:hypothetical protein
LIIVGFLLPGNRTKRTATNQTTANQIVTNRIAATPQALMEHS